MKWLKKKSLISIIKANKLEFIFLCLITALAIFLRFYHINELHFFTYDQARDDLIVKRILVDHQWTLLGPQSSMQGVYLPPFYYYTLVPVLWLARLNPVGVDVYTALVGVLTVLLLWWILREFFGKSPALMVSFLYATSPLIVELSHRAWNPNTQPFFVLLMIFFLYKLFTTKKEKFLIFTSLVFGYAVNLHYGALSLIIIWFFAFVWGLVKLKRKWLVLFSGLVLFLFGAPLLLFDFRHNFMLTKNIWEYFFVGERISLSPKAFIEPMIASTYQLFVALLSGSFLKTAQVPFEFWGKLGSVLAFAPVSIIAHKPLLVQYQWWGIGLLALIFTAIIWFKFHRTDRPQKIKQVSLVLRLLIATVLIGTLVSRFYIGNFYFFYYIFLYPLPFLFLGFLFWCLWQKKVGKAVAVLIFLGMFIFNSNHVLVVEKSGRTRENLDQVAKVIANDADLNKTFNVAANYFSPDRWDHHALDYRYFIEAFYGKRPLDWQPQDYEKAEVLYLVAEGGMTDPLESRIMEIEKFAPQRINKRWPLDNNITVFKLEK